MPLHVDVIPKARERALGCLTRDRTHSRTSGFARMMQMDLRSRGRACSRLKLQNLHPSGHARITAARARSPLDAYVHESSRLAFPRAPTLAGSALGPSAYARYPHKVRQTKTFCISITRVSQISDTDFNTK